MLNLKILKVHFQCALLTSDRLWKVLSLWDLCVFCWPSLIGQIVICWMSIVLQIEDLKNDNALLRAQLQQHGLEISETTSQWQKKKKPLSRINSLKWRNNSSMTHLLTPHHRLKMFCNSSSVWMLVWYTDTLPSEQRLSDRCENKICCKSTLCFFPSLPRELNNLDWSIWNNPLLPEVSRFPQVFVFSLNLGIVNQ